MTDVRARDYVILFLIGIIAGLIVLNLWQARVRTVDPTPIRVQVVEVLVMG